MSLQGFADMDVQPDWKSECKENWANQVSIPEKVCRIVHKESEIQYAHPNVHRVKYCKWKE